MRYAKNAGGASIAPDLDGTLMDYDSNQKYKLVPVDGKTPTTPAEPKPSSYTHQAAISAALTALSAAMSQQNAAQQNAFLNCAIALASYVEAASRPRAR